MKLTVEQVKNLKNADDNLIAALRKEIPNSYYGERNPLDELMFDHNGERFTLCEHECTPWDDDGKYSFRTEYYQLCSYNPDIENYLCDQSKTGEYDILVSIGATKSGSYFSEYYYEYSDITIEKVKLSHVPEVVIPEHDEVVLVGIRGKKNK